MTLEHWQIFGNYMLMYRWPELLVGIAGLYFCARRWKRHPRVSAIAAVGLLCYLLSAGAWVMIQAGIEVALQSGRDLSRPDLPEWLGWVATRLSVIAVAVILVAVFVDRQTPPPEKRGLVSALRLRLIPEPRSVLPAASAIAIQD